jgi:VanZ family protein
MADVPIPVIALRREREQPSPIVPGVALRWSANLAYAALLVTIALLPSTSSVLRHAPPDWLSHAAAYGLQCVLLHWALARSVGAHRALLGAFLGAVAFGSVNEGLQLLQPGRAVEARDLLANATGALIACGAIAGIRRRDQGGAV